MYSLDRTQKLKVITIITSVLFFVLSFCGYLFGGHELIDHDFMNEAFSSIAMVVCFVGGIITLLLALLVNAIQKDIAEHLRYLDNKNEK